MSIQNLKLKSKFFFLTIIFCGVFGVVEKTFGATINAVSPEFSDVSAAVAVASYGDTVNVPSGQANWGNNTLTITKGINLIGAGPDSTIIVVTPTSYSTSKYMISFEADATTATENHPFRLEGFHLKADGSYPPYGLLHLVNTHYTEHLTNVAITNNRFQQLITGSTSVSIILETAIFGVVYNNEIIDGTHAWRFLGSMPTGKEVIYWEPGSQYAMYFEDNYIHISEAWSTNQLISGGAGNRYVSRYNTFNLSLNGPSQFTQTHDIHGNQTNNPGAGIGFEAYGEHRLGGSGRWIDQRGGRAHFFMNQWSETNGAGSYNIWEEFDDDLYSATSCVGLNYPKTGGGVNCLQSPYDSYYWRNFTGINGTTLVTDTNILYDHFNRDTSIINNPLTLLENQAWWRDNAASFTGAVDTVGSCGFYGGPECTKSGIGCGDLSLMQSISTCDQGTAFWVTNQGNCSDISDYVGHDHTKNIQGTLYKCGLSNNWVVSYMPYTYPHPLRNENDITAPVAPSGLSVN